MPGSNPAFSRICIRYLRPSQRHNAAPVRMVPVSRRFSQLLPLENSDSAQKTGREEDENTIKARLSSRSAKSIPVPHEKEQGAMSRRLSEATEEALLEGGRAGRKAIEDAGFSDELKRKLLQRVEASKFRYDNAAAFAEEGLTSKVGRGSREIASGAAWFGEENTEDTVLRMLDDVHKPLKPGLRARASIPEPIVDLRLRREQKQHSGQRLANARDKTSIYAGLKDNNMTEKEREDMRKELRERFTPGARAMPNSIRGLAALANERIEDAIARGQFKNIPRGKAIERDARADNPFINTTEYIMNKMIQRQEIVPPWIEKQQDLVKAANVFRARLRNDWKRHAARTISSRGGSLQEQMRTAEQYADAERIHNPKTRKVEEISVPTSATSDPVMIKITQEAPSAASVKSASVVQISVGSNDVELPVLVPQTAKSSRSSPETSSPDFEDDTAQHTQQATQIQELQPSDLPPPFRIPSWESSERSYLILAITNLNNLTRSYNLMAPELAKKPYFNLEREMKSCCADVAPELAQIIKERAARPPRDLVEKIGHAPGSVLERFSREDKARIYDNKKPLYGFKQFWNDLFRQERA